MKIMQRGFMSLACYLLAALAHILAGGSAFSATSGVALALLSISTGLLMEKSHGKLPQILFLIYFIQFTSHFILGGTGSSDVRMLVAHVSSAIATYQLLRFFDRQLPSIFYLFESVFNALYFVSITVPQRPRLRIVSSNVHPLSLFHFSQQLTRAPPLL